MNVIGAVQVFPAPGDGSIVNSLKPINVEERRCVTDRQMA